jgi:hypothetical protein
MLHKLNQTILSVDDTRNLFVAHPQSLEFILKELHLIRSDVDVSRSQEAVILYVFLLSHGSEAQIAA